jgi:hypothetical protein
METMKKRTIKNRDLHSISGTDKIIMSVDEFPFKTVFTFKYLIDHWRNTAKQEGSVSKAQLDLLEERLAQAPELAEPIEDLSILEKHKDTLELMISPFFPVQSWNMEIKALGKLFSERLFYTSPRFEKIIGPKGTFILKEENQDKKNLTLFWRLLYAYKFILDKFYRLSLVIDQPMIYTLPHVGTGLDHYYKLTSYAPFSQLENIQALPALDTDTFDYLVNNFHTMDLWIKYLPPQNFVFSGFGIHSFVDVTVEEATARLEHILLSNHGNISDESFDRLQRELKILFRLPDLRLGLASLQGDGALNLHSRKKSWNSLKIGEAHGITPGDIDRSLYGKMIRENQTIIIEDLSIWEEGTKVESELLRLGVRNITLSPLFYQDQRVGLLEITSPNPGDIDALSSYKLTKVIQFFARAVHENRERFESRVQRVVREYYTAIHPSVEWRFREAAILNLDRQQAGVPAEPESILFERVYPLYGAADIRGSSHQRNKSIRDDLVEHLNLAIKLLREVNKSIPMVINRELEFTLNKKVLEIPEYMSPGDESSTIDFILHEVNPLFRHLQQSYPSLQPLLRSFMDQTLAGTDVLYKKRRAYESSLKTINEAIDAHLMKEQQHLQKIFPHYFEKYQTDGVEYNMYIGSSLVKDREFAPVYLWNLRLHQLITACEIARKIDDLQPELEEPLSITQLILVHSTPVNIRFRMDEKQFDVDGSYNVRYEIMKKRIDKAVISGTEERITQPGHIAIIYSMEKERVEYARYIEFLKDQGYIKNDPEYLKLDALQGVEGLKAIRLEVNLQRADSKPATSMDTLEILRRIGDS